MLIRHGATSLMVSGIVPAGCEPPILLYFDGADPASYDPMTGCLKEMNELSIHHNSLLQESLAKIRADHPDVEITYADFFGPVMEMVESPAKFGKSVWSAIVSIKCSWPDAEEIRKVVIRRCLQDLKMMLSRCAVEGRGGGTTSTQ